MAVVGVVAGVGGYPFKVNDPVWGIQLRVVDDQGEESWVWFDQTPRGRDEAEQRAKDLTQEAKLDRLLRGLAREAGTHVVVGGLASSQPEPVHSAHQLRAAVLPHHLWGLVRARTRYERVG